MDMESISSVNSNYSSTESVKVKRAPVESAHTAAQSVSEASSAAVRTVSESGEETNRVSIKVINEDTDEVIREIPPEKSLDMLQKMWEMAGILVDEKR